MLENIGHDFDGANTEVPLDNVDTKTLRKVVQWMEHCKDEQQPTSEEIKEKLSETIPEWEEEYLQMELHDLYDLVRKKQKSYLIVY